MISLFKIENEAEADSYLKDLLSNEKHRSLDEVVCRAQKFIDDTRLRDYFINRANDIIKGF